MGWDVCLGVIKNVWDDLIWMVEWCWWWWWCLWFWCWGDCVWCCWRWCDGVWLGCWCMKCLRKSWVLRWWILWEWWECMCGEWCEWCLCEWMEWWCLWGMCLCVEWCCIGWRNGGSWMMRAFGRRGWCVLGRGVFVVAAGCCEVCVEVWYFVCFLSLCLWCRLICMLWIWWYCLYFLGNDLCFRRVRSTIVFFCLIFWM